MSHEIETMFSVKQVPWHGLGNVVNDAGSSAEAIELAGLDWKVEKRPIYIPVPEGDDFDYRSISDKFATVRNSDNSVLGIVGKNYQPLQNSDAFKFFDESLASKELSFETAGALKNGKHVWILASIKSGPIEIVKGDAVKPFLLLTNGHDGMRAVSVGFTPIRVVCANTLAAAELNSSTEMVRMKHSQYTLGNLEKVKEIINVANATFQASVEQYQFLASRQVCNGDLEKFVKVIFPKNQSKERSHIAEEKIQEDIKRLFEVGKGQEIKGVKGTYWALYNATTEYLSYEAGRSNDSRMFNLWMGQNKNLSAEALEVTTSMAKGAF